MAYGGMTPPETHASHGHTLARDIASVIAEQEIQVMTLLIENDGKTPRPSSKYPFCAGQFG